MGGGPGSMRSQPGAQEARGADTKKPLPRPRFNYENFITNCVTNICTLLISSTNPRLDDVAEAVSLMKAIARSADKGLPKRDPDTI